MTTRCPTLWPRGAETARREAQIFDPYPDEKWGPTVGFRPLEFSQQRSKPQQAKDRFFTSFLKSNYGQPAAVPQPVPQTPLPQTPLAPGSSVPYGAPPTSYAPASPGYAPVGTMVPVALPPTASAPGMVAPAW